MKQGMNMSQMNPLMQPLIMGFQERMASEQKEMENLKTAMEKHSQD